MRPAAAGHPDPLSEPERLSAPFVVSLVFHGAVAGLFLGSALIKLNTVQMGDQNAGAGVSVNAVKTIPIPAKQGQINRLANNTESVVPQEPLKLKDQRPPREPEPTKAIELPSRTQPKPLPPRPSSPTQYRPRQEYQKNQVFTRTPEALKSPQIGTQGSNGVGIGPNSPFGFQFGAYAQQIRDLIAQKWNQSGVSAVPSQQAVLTFRIQRDGSVSNVEVAGPSGSYTLDTSAKRAILDANPLPPLPGGFNRNSADVELTFQIRR